MHYTSQRNLTHENHLVLYFVTEEEEVDKMMEQKQKEEEERKRKKEMEERMSLDETKEQVETGTKTNSLNTFQRTHDL